MYVPLIKESRNLPDLTEYIHLKILKLDNNLLEQIDGNNLPKSLVLLICNNNQITNNVLSHMPYILSEQIILNGVKLGYSRQDIHERLRIILIKIKQDDQSHYNLTNNIKSVFKNDDIIDTIIKTTNISIDPENYIGRSVHQTNTFYENILF